MGDEPTIPQKIEQLISAQKSLFLATIDPDNQPFASYAPFAFDWQQGELYVFLSQLSAHCRHLQRHPHASVLIAQDETDTEQIYARLRVQYQVTASIVDGEQRDAHLDKLRQRQGEVIDLLTSLPDFHLFVLQINSGSYVQGFGAAFRLAAGGFAEQAQHIGPDDLKR